MIDLHYVATANGLKIGILLEELQIEYRVIPYDIFDGQHLTREFRRLNPNNKLPVIVDHKPADGGEPITVFETGAIMLYLGEKCSKFLPARPRLRTVVQQWLIWQVSGLGPMHGQAHHFVRYAPEGQQYGLDRYTKEARRQINVLEHRLSEVDYLGGEYSIADIAAFPWVQAAYLLGIDIKNLPATAAWSARLFARPAITAALSKIELKVPEHYMRESARLNPEQWSNMFGDRMHGAASLQG